MNYDELELDRLGDEKTALFFLICDTDTTYNFIVALAFSQMKRPTPGRCRGWKSWWPSSGHGKSA